MARIESVADAPENPEIARLFDWVRAQGVEVPNLYRALAASPAMLGAWIDFAWALRLRATTPRALRELMILRGAQVAGVDYEWAHHLPMARAAGVSEAQIAALADWRESDLFDADARAALALAEEVAAGPGASAETIEALRARFPDEAVVELVLTASFYACVSRVLVSLGIELEPGFSESPGA